MKVTYENNGFSAETTRDWKHIEIKGPGLPGIMIDFDDVNHEETEMEVIRLVNLLAEHWPVLKTRADYKLNEFGPLVDDSLGQKR